MTGAAQRMSIIRLVCECDHEFPVGRDCVGAKVRCPECGRILQVVAPPEEERDPTQALVDRVGKNRASREKAPCYLCRKKNSRIISFWSAVPGEWVRLLERIRPEGQDTGPSYRNLTRHRVPVCKSCLNTMWRRYNSVTIIIAWGGAALFILLVWVFAFGFSGAGKASNLAAFLRLFVVLVLTVGAGMFSVWHVFWRRVGPGAVEDVVRSAVGREIAPRHHTATLTTAQVNDLEKNQIIGGQDVSNDIVRPRESQRNDDDGDGDNDNDD